MKLHESGSLTFNDNKKSNFERIASSYNLHINKILIVLLIGIIFTLCLVSINPLINRGFKDLNLRDYFMIYSLIIFSFLSWTVSRILYKNYCNRFDSKEIEKNKRENAELIKSNKELKKLSFTDQLTGIANRRCFINYIDSEYEQKLKKNSLVSIIMIDVDFFKQYNDYLGHCVADKILIAVAKEINSVCKSITGVAARYGGDEFIITTINSDEKQIHELAKAIRNRVNALVVPNNKLDSIRNISVSIGTSTVRINTKDDINKCIDFADKALYEAKSNGRNCVRNKSDCQGKQGSKYYVAS